MEIMELLQAASAAHQGKQAADAAKAERERAQDETRLRNTINDLLGDVDLPISFRADRWRGQMAYAPLPGPRGTNLHTNQGGALFLGRPCPQCGDEEETHVSNLATLGAALADDSLCTECRYKAEAAPVEKYELVARTFTGDGYTVQGAAAEAHSGLNRFLHLENIERGQIKALRCTQSSYGTYEPGAGVDNSIQYAIFTLLYVPAEQAARLRGV